MFELAAVLEAAIKEFTARGNQVEAALAERGKTRADATAAEKAILTLATRQAKQEIQSEALVPGWREQADGIGFGTAEWTAAIAESQARAARMPARSLADTGRAEAVALLAVAAAARQLSKREAVFGAAALEARAGEHAGGRASATEIAAAVDRARAGGELVGRDRGAAGQGFTTCEAVATERRMLAIEHSARGAADTPYDRQEAARIVTTAAFFAEARGHKWTEGQQSATIGLLTGRDRVVGVQGYAGTAKTTTVLATYAEGMRSAGYEVRAFAPTAAAASVLGDAIGAKGETVAKAVLIGE